MMNRRSKGNRLNTHELDSYLNKLSEKPIPDQRQQHIYAIAAKNGDMRARTVLIEANLKLVVHLAKDYQEHADLMELVLAGNEALCKALDHYNPGKGCCFGTYASIWIRDAMLTSIEEQQRIVRIPRRAAQQLNKIKKSGEEGLTEKRADYIKSIDIKRNVVEMSLFDDILDNSSEESASKVVRDILSIMPPLMASYLNMAFGIDCNPMPTREIGDILGMTRTAAFQLRRDSMESFRKLWNRERAA